MAVKKTWKGPLRTRHDIVGRDFAKLWAGETVSLTGSEITTLAIPLSAILLLHASPWQVGLLAASRWAPYILLAIPAGVWVDRHRRRPILIASNLGQAGLLAIVPVLDLSGQLTLLDLIVVSFLVGALAVFFELAYTAYLPTLVSSPNLTRANGRIGMSESVAEIGGPGLGGALVQLASAPSALIADSASFVVSASALLAIRKKEPPPPAAAPRTLRRDIAEGFQVTLRDALLRAFAGEAASYNFFWQVIQSVLALYIIRELGLTAGTYGLIFAVGSVGALLGAAFTERVAARRGLGTTMIAAAVIGDVAPLAIPAVHFGGSAAIAALSAVFFVRGVGITGCNVHVMSMRQAITPNRLLGRTAATYRLLVYGVVPLGALAGGALGQLMGLRATLLCGAVGLLGTSLWLVLSPLRRIDSLEDVARAAED